jgi:hypothetical protein
VIVVLVCVVVMVGGFGDGGTNLELGITGMVRVSVVMMTLVEGAIDVVLGNRGVGLDNTLDDEGSVESGILVESGMLVKSGMLVESDTPVDLDTLALLVPGMSKLEKLGG